MAIINPNTIRRITLYTGQNGPEGCVCKCPCCSQLGKEIEKYQGTEQQIEELLEKFPNLEQLYILGNPDPAVDFKFCNLVAKRAIAHDAKVCFSTSGVGGERIMKIILNDVSTEYVDYLSFSIDSLEQEKLNILKGINYPFEAVEEAIEWAISQGYNVKIQPTLWSSNFMEVESIIEYFALKKVKWYTFHIGSIESCINLPTHKHLTSREVQNVHDQIERALKKYPDIKVRCPIIFHECGKNDKSKWYCTRGEECEELQVYFAKDGIWCTNAPIASKYISQFKFNLNNNVYEVPKLNLKEEICPYSKELSGMNKNLCRYISKTWNY